jgi:hypothetical protein
MIERGVDIAANRPHEIPERQVRLLRADDLVNPEAVPAERAEPKSYWT